MRLDKLISNNSSFSRKEATKIIRNKNVSINGVIVTNPSANVSEEDKILIYNKPIKISNFVYIALNKPKNYICSTNNNNGESILSLIEKNYVKNIHIVGRLDKDTTGLIIITNDGNFTHELKSSRYYVEKEYEVTLKNNFTQEMHNELINKEIILDGKKIKPFKLININKNKLNIVLFEGKYHQIKRIFNIVKNPVIDLKRIRIGKLHLSNLKINEGESIEINKNYII